MEADKRGGEVRLNGRFEGEFEAASARAGADWLIHRRCWSAVLIGYKHVRRTMPAKKCRFPVGAEQ